MRRRKRETLSAAVRSKPITDKQTPLDPYIHLDRLIRFSSSSSTSCSGRDETVCAATGPSGPTPRCAEHRTRSRLRIFRTTSSCVANQCYPDSWISALDTVERDERPSIAWHATLTSCFLLLAAVIVDQNSGVLLLQKKPSQNQSTWIR